MWFVVYLFVFCLLLLPVFGLFRMRALAGFKDKAASAFSHRFVIEPFRLPRLLFGLKQRGPRVGPQPDNP